MAHNPTGVVTSTSAGLRALEYLEAADTYRATLRDLLGTARPGPLSEHKRRVAEANADLGQALKAAEVCATLAVAEEIAALRASRPVPINGVVTL